MRRTTRFCSVCSGDTRHMTGCPETPDPEDEAPALDGDADEAPGYNEDDDREYSYDEQLDRAQAARDRQYEAWRMKR